MLVRVLALLALVAAPLAWSAGGCASQPSIVPARPMPNNMMELPTILESIRADASPWHTLQADCTVIVNSPQLNVRGHQVNFVRGRLQIEKPGKIRLEAVTGQLRIFLVGDGTDYRVDLPAFNDGYKGKYGGPLPVQPQRILIMPDDLVTAWDWTRLFKGVVPVLKNLQGGAVLELLEMVSDPTPDIKAASEVAFDRTQRRVTSAETYSKDSRVRAQIVVRAVDTIEGADKQPVRVPRLVWVGYPASWTSIQITLRNIELDKELPKGTFDLKS